MRHGKKNSGKLASNNFKASSINSTKSRKRNMAWGVFTLIFTQYIPRENSRKPNWISANICYTIYTPSSTWIFMFVWIFSCLFLNCNKIIHFQNKIWYTCCPTMNVTLCFFLTVKMSLILRFVMSIRFIFLYHQTELEQ